jgi:ankyrin repeat protein
VHEDENAQEAGNQDPQVVANNNLAPDENDNAEPLVAFPLRGIDADTISPLLYDMIRQGASCSLLQIRIPDDHFTCTAVVKQSKGMPDQSFYLQPRLFRTPLHEACLRKACICIIQALLNANPVAVMERDVSGNLPLHLLFQDYYPSALTVSSSTRSLPETARLLLQNNPVHLAVAVNGQGQTPLHIFCQAKTVDLSVLEILLQANPNAATIQAHDHKTPLHIYCQQPLASPDVCRLLLQAHPGAARALDQQGYTPLHHACRVRNVQVISTLLQAGESSPAMRTLVTHKTALHSLVGGRYHLQSQHVPALKALIYAAPELLLLPDSSGKTPLHIACAIVSQPLLVIELLASNPQACALTDADQATPLHIAAQVGATPAVIITLLQHYPAAASMVTRKQDTPLHLACHSNVCSETVQLLMAYYPAALQQTNDYNFTPLHCVCRAHQPKLGIVAALVKAWPESVWKKTHGGETPLHLACSSGAFVGVLQLLTTADTPSVSATPPAATNKVGNSPLHEACFRGAFPSQIETLAKSTPEWITLKNNAGYTPLQLLAKSGRLNETVVTTFCRIRGSQAVLNVQDTTGHLPLHSACREGTSLSAIQSLIRAFPDALQRKTQYGDTPLHLAVLRGASVDVVQEIANAELLLETNKAGQTPISIAMDDYVASHPCSDSFSGAQKRAFDVMATLVKMLCYGNCHGSLVQACVSLHRRDVRLDPAFIQRAIYLHPEEVKMHGGQNYPLHIEASIPVEKMSLLDGRLDCTFCRGKYHRRRSILGCLLSVHPEATKARNDADEFVLGLMIRNGRGWDSTFSLVLRHFPPALHWYKGMNQKLTPEILAKVSSECGVDTLYQLVQSKPEMVGS